MDKADRSETSLVTTRIRQRWRTSWSKGNVGHDRVDEIFLVALVLKLLGNHVIATFWGGAQPPAKRIEWSWASIPVLNGAARWGSDEGDA